MKNRTLTAKSIFTAQNIGMFLALVACIIFWLPIYKYDEVHGIWFFKRIEEKKLDLKPGIISGVIALFLSFVLYIRGIIMYRNKWTGFISFLINLTLFATLVEIFISPVHEKAFVNFTIQTAIIIVACAVCVAILLFGVKELAKLVLLIFFIATFYMNLKLVNDAMGFVGYINLVIVLVSFFLQQNISLKALGDEFNYLVGGIHKSKSLTEAEIDALIDSRISKQIEVQVEKSIAKMQSEEKENSGR